MLLPEYTNQFKKDLKILKKRNVNMELIKEIIILLCNEKELPKKYKDHILFGGWVGRRECHIKPDWLMIYQSDGLKIVFERTGSHSDLF